MSGQINQLDVRLFLIEITTGNLDISKRPHRLIGSVVYLILCPISSSMARYKRRGKISDIFFSWWRIGDE